MGKLVRNKIPKIILADGHKPITRRLGDGEYLTELGKKAVEEAQEFAEAHTTEAKMGELADLQEVINTSVVALGQTPAGLEAIRAKKAQERGGFSERIYWAGNAD